MTVASHFVFGSTASYSHCPPLINAALALLSAIPDLAISFILHVNNQSAIEHLVQRAEESVGSRLKLYPVGEKTELSDASGSYIQMVYKSGEAYGTILATCAPWPSPSVFVFDVTSFFYVMVKTKVEENFPHLKPARLVAYNPMNALEIVYAAGSVDNGSLRWVKETLDAVDSEAMAVIDIVAEGDKIVSGALDREKEKQARIIQIYRDYVTESDKIVKIAGYPPFHLYERWSVDVDWSNHIESGWFSYLAGLQGSVLAPEAWLNCFPSSIVEPETFAVAAKDVFLSSDGKRPFFELGWYATRPGESWGEGVRAFLDKHGEKEVIYISFGTIVEAGFGLSTVFELLEKTRTPYIYACGRQKNKLPAAVLSLLARGEAEGRCLAPDWADQIGVLSHRAIKCFISHCGVNSLMESIIAGVPILCWGRRWDQVQLSSLVHSAGIGIELLQHRSGHAIGRSVAHRPDVIVSGKPDELEKELEAAFMAVDGEQGKEMERKLGAIGAKIKEKKEGEWKDALKAFGKYGRE